jgi:hypothetical protein
MATFPQQGSASIEIRATPEAVWDLISDITRMGEWSPECVRAEWVDGANRAGLGARFHGYNRRGQMEWDVPCVVTVCERARTFAFDVPPDSPVATRWRFDVTPSDRGTMLTESFDAPIINVEGSVANYEGRFEALVAGVETTLARVKVAAEASQ